MNQVEIGLNRHFDDIKWFMSIMLGILKRQGSIEKSLETQKDEIHFLKSVAEKLLPPKGVL